MVRRILFCTIWIGFAAAPMLAAFQIMQILAATKAAPAAPTATPNPPPAAPTSLGPLELLVYADPWLAGVGGIWMIGGTAAILVAIVLGAVFVDPYDSRFALRGPAFVSLAILALGIFFAIPWIYGIYRLFIQA